MRMHAHDSTTARGWSVAGTVSLAVLAVGLALTAADLPMAWLAWPLGYGVLLPLSIGYATRRDRDDDRVEDDTESDPVSDLRERYVTGELTDREFEAELESVLAEEER